MRPRTGDGQFEAFAAHVLEKNREMKFTATGDFPDGFVVGVTHAHGDVGLELAFETFANLAGRHELAFTAGERRGVNLEVHRQGRLIDLEHREGFGLLKIGDRRADGELFNAVDEHDVAGFGFIDELTLETLELQDLIDLHALRGVFRTVHDRDVHVRADAAAMHAADADLAHVARVVERADLKHQGAVGIVVTDGDVLDDVVEDGAHVADLLELFDVGRVTGKAVESGGVDHGEVELVFRGTELVEEVERLVDDPVGTGARAVDLVDDDDGLEALGESLAGHEARLRHRAFNGVDEEQHAVDHGEDAFNFTAEVSMPRGVNDVDVRTFVFDGAVLRENGDAAFAFQIVGVHHAFSNLLIGAEGAGAAKQAVHHRGLAVVDVRDDRNVTNSSSHLFLVLI